MDDARLMTGQQSSSKEMDSVESNFFTFALKGHEAMNFVNSRKIFVIAACVIGFFISVTALAEDKKNADAKAAEINGVVITKKQFDKELNIHLDRVARQGRQLPESQMAGLKEDILDGLIERELLYQESKKAGVNVKQQAIDDQLAAIKKRFPSEEQFHSALTQMNLSEVEVRTQIERGLAIRELIDQKIASKIIISDAQTKAYYESNPQMFKQPEQIKASHILVKVDAGAAEAQKTEARKKIETVQQKVKNGDDFAQLAKEYSEGPSKTRGGDLGYFRRGQMVKPFDDAAFAMQKNEVSDIVTTRFGYHLIKVYDKKPAKTMAYTDVKEKLTERIKQEEVEKQATQYISQLKKEANIQKFI
jgi:peptidyl-prolyl cis-trans isomerase C